VTVSTHVQHVENSLVIDERGVGLAGRTTDNVVMPATDEVLDVVARQWP